MTPQQIDQMVRYVNFNDRLLLLDLIHFARYSAASYGDTNILQQFLEGDEIKRRMDKNKKEQEYWEQRAANSHYWR